MLLVGAGNITRTILVIHTEAVAAFKAIQQATQLGMIHIILETDAFVSAASLRSKGIDRSSVGCLVRQIQVLMRTEFFLCNFSLCNRSCNKVVDFLEIFVTSMAAG